MPDDLLFSSIVQSICKVASGLHISNAHSCEDYTEQTARPVLDNLHSKSLVKEYLSKMDLYTAYNENEQLLRSMEKIYNSIQETIAYSHVAAMVQKFEQKRNRRLARLARKQAPTRISKTKQLPLNTFLVPSAVQAQEESPLDRSAREFLLHKFDALISPLRTTLSQGNNRIENWRAGLARRVPNSTNESVQIEEDWSSIVSDLIRMVFLFDSETVRATAIDQQQRIASSDGVPSQPHTPDSLVGSIQILQSLVDILVQQHQLIRNYLNTSSDGFMYEYYALCLIRSENVLQDVSQEYHPVQETSAKTIFALWAKLLQHLNDEDLSRFVKELQYLCDSSSQVNDWIKSSVDNLNDLDDELQNIIGSKTIDLKLMIKDHLLVNCQELAIALKNQLSEKSRDNTHQAIQLLAERIESTITSISLVDMIRSISKLQYFRHVLFSFRESYAILVSQTPEFQSYLFKLNKQDSADHLLSYLKNQSLMKPPRTLFFEANREQYLRTIGVNLMKLANHNGNFAQVESLVATFSDTNDSNMELPCVKVLNAEAEKDIEITVDTNTDRIVDLDTIIGNYEANEDRLLKDVFKGDPSLSKYVDQIRHYIADTRFQVSTSQSSTISDDDDETQDNYEDILESLKTVTELLIIPSEDSLIISKQNIRGALTSAIHYLLFNVFHPSQIATIQWTSFVVNQIHTCIRSATFATALEARITGVSGEGSDVTLKMITSRTISFLIELLKREQGFLLTEIQHICSFCSNYYLQDIRAFQLYLVPRIDDDVTGSISPSNETEVQSLIVSKFQPKLFAKITTLAKSLLHQADKVGLLKSIERDLKVSVDSFGPDYVENLCREALFILMNEHLLEVCLPSREKFIDSKHRHYPRYVDELVVRTVRKLDFGKYSDVYRSLLLNASTTSSNIDENVFMHIEQVLLVLENYPMDYLFASNISTEDIDIPHLHPIMNVSVLHNLFSDPSVAQLQRTQSIFQLKFGHLYNDFISTCVKESDHVYLQFIANTD